MAEAAYDSLFPQVLALAPNCPEPVVLTALRDACHEFCVDTLFVTEEIDAIDVQAGVSTYTIDCPRAGYEIVQLVGQPWFLSRRLMPRSPDELNRMYTVSWRTLTKEVPDACVMFRKDELTLVPTPSVDTAAAITGRVALAPTLTSTRADADMLRLYREGISQGALAKIFAIPDQPYTHDDKALFYGRLFEAAKGNAGARARSSFRSAPMRVIPPKFW